MTPRTALSTWWSSRRVAFGRWTTSVRRRPRRTASTAVVAVSAVGLLAAMLLADGFLATSYDLRDASVWVTRSSQPTLGRINTQIARQDAAVSAGLADDSPIDVVQDGTTVLLHDRTAGELSRVDAATVQLAEAPEPIRPGASVAMAGGTVVVSDPATGAVWVSSPDSIVGGRDGGDEPTFELEPVGVPGAEVAVAVGAGGEVAAYAADDHELLVLTRGGGAPERIPLQGDPVVSPQVSLVGDVPVVLDRERRVLFVGDRPPVELGSLQSPQLQLPGDDRSTIIVATATVVVEVDVDSGGQRVLPESGVVADVPIAPVRVGGCTYAAWSGARTEFVACDGQKPVERKLQELSSPVAQHQMVDGEAMRFRVNRTHVALNLLQSGASFALAEDGELRRVDDWGTLGEQEVEDDQADDSDEPIIELLEEQRPPIAVDDDHFGARPSRASVLGVLDNDGDPNGDPLVIESLVGVGADGIVADGTTVVSLIQSGQAVQILPGPQSGGSKVEFGYTISDGRGGTDEATVRVAIRSDGEPNLAPQRKPDRNPLLEMRWGETATYDVLQDWFDPDGDPLVLSSAALVNPNGADTVTALAGGSLSFDDAGTVAGPKPVAVSVSDLFEEPLSTEGRLDVEVRGDDRVIAPLARPDFARTLVGNRVVLQPLANDFSGSGGELRVTKVETAGLPAGMSVEHQVLDDTVSFESTVPGTAVFHYQLSDGGPREVEGAIRVDVVAPGQNVAPAAAVDVIVVPAGGMRTVDLLANDFDPDGDVLAVESVQVPTGRGVEATVLEHRRLRVALESTLAAPVPLTYRVTDGPHTVTGQVWVVMAPPGTSNQPPKPVDDGVTVRAGDVVSIPVLANDSDPDGDELTLSPELLIGAPAGDGLAFVSGSTVRYQAPNRATTVLLSYEVKDPSGEANSATVRVAVKDPDAESTPPRPATVEARVTSGSRVRIQVPLTGIDPDGDSVSLDGLDSAPAQGRVVTPIGTDSIEYEAFEDAAPGTDVFGYRVRDRTGKVGVGTIRIAVISRPDLNQPPVAFDDRVSVRPGTTVRAAVVKNDYDPDGDAIGFAADRPIEVPEGVAAEVIGNTLQITAGDAAAPPIRYSISDGRGGYDSALVTVAVDPLAPNLAPIARDDEVRSVQPPDATSQTVDVRTNDEDPDGDPAALKVTLMAPAPEWAGVVDDKVVVELGPTARVVAYTVDDGLGGTSSAFVKVPALGSSTNRPPEQLAHDPLRIVTGEALAIRVGDHVQDPEGARVVLLGGDRVSATRSATQGSDMVVDDQTLKFVSSPGFVGQASVTFEVTDGTGPDDPEGRTAVISLPIEVSPVPGSNTPPVARGVASLRIAPGEESARVDLATYFTDAERDELEFSGLSGVPTGISAKLDGSVLVAGADASAAIGRHEIGIQVSDGPATTAGTVVIEVVPSPRERPRAIEDVVDKADAGSAVTVPVLRNDWNPFEDGELHLVSTSVVSADSGAAVVSGSDVVFTPRSGFSGTATLTYVVQDKLRDVARQAEGTVRVNVRDVPSAPGAPRVEAVASKQVTLGWQPPAANGTPLLGYVVKWAGGSQECSSTTCQITGLSNDTTYWFTVTARNEVGSGAEGPRSAEARPDQRPDMPAAPTLLFDPQRPDGQLDATWVRSAPDGSPVRDYEVEISPAPTGGTAAQRLGTQLSIHYSGLQNGTAYRVRVRAHNAAPEPSDWSDWSAPEVPAKAPDRPAPPTVTQFKDGIGERLRVAWVAPPNNGDVIASYTLSVHQAGVATPERTIPVVDAALEQIVPVVNGVQYTFTVAATNKAGPSAVSGQSDPQLSSGAPLVVAAAPVASNQDGSAQLTIVNPDDNGQAIRRFEVRVNGNDGDIRELVGANRTIGGLTNGQRYRFEVLACNDDCQTVWSPASNEARPLAPLGEPRIWPVKEAGGTADFEWSLPPYSGRAITRVHVCIDIECQDETGFGPRGASPGFERTVGVSIRVWDEDGRTTSFNSSGYTGDRQLPSWNSKLVGANGTRAHANSDTSGGFVTIPAWTTVEVQCRQDVPPGVADSAGDYWYRLGGAYAGRFASSNTFWLADGIDQPDAGGDVDLRVPSC